ncbi:unnamed protein product [Thelazia callipaeda]|uniref:DUF1330 domain-containing protein n=1 Tax=Thelazia callipaeda TaxID=103827 RepID=A0A0N5DAT4_THECL|nr:unnamed protein product [Thelazia callipaeda]
MKGISEDFKIEERSGGHSIFQQPKRHFDGFIYFCPPLTTLKAWNSENMDESLLQKISSLSRFCIGEGPRYHFKKSSEKEL